MKKSHKYLYILLYRTVNQFLIKSVNKQHYLFPTNINIKRVFKESLETDIKKDRTLYIKSTPIMFIRVCTNVVIGDREANTNPFVISSDGES